MEIQPQPDETTCGPTALHAVYRYWGDEVELARIIREVPVLGGGGTLGVLLASHALRRGYKVRLYSYNLQLFDPTWAQLTRPELRRKLAQQLVAKSLPKLQFATAAYSEFLALGGELALEDLSPALLARHLDCGEPLLAGLSATYLYRTAREVAATNQYDDVRGEPSGHFVVLCDYDAAQGLVRVADPWRPNPVAPGQIYEISVERVITAILLGVITYDGNLVQICPQAGPRVPDVTTP